jgi:16S rRNA A1518/A1519 N6-dimethyltransferase RsmA/KsgA/DIM1 with predicted DNA glycosylase/AP lyase activity
VGLCFRQKRKKIRNNLLHVFDKSRLDAIPETSKRAEQLSIPDFIALYDKLRFGTEPRPQGSVRKSET